MQNPTFSSRHLRAIPLKACSAIAVCALLSTACQQAPETTNPGGKTSSSSSNAPTTSPTLTVATNTDSPTAAPSTAAPPTAAPPVTALPGASAQTSLLTPQPVPEAEPVPGVVPQAAASAASTASGLQQPDENGDYYQPRRRSEGSRTWRVVDPDPTGLNCRMKRDWQGITFGHVNAPEEMGKDYSANIGAWEVMATLLPGDSLTADGGHLSQGIFVLDQDGKPWLAISRSGSSPATCFVRANSAFIQPQ